MRAIDADVLKTKKVRSTERHEWVVPVAVIDWMPTIKPEPKKGKWIPVTDSQGQHAECQYCGEWKYHLNQKFCGECGSYNGGGE